MTVCTMTREGGSLKEELACEPAQEEEEEVGRSIVTSL